MRTNCSKEFVAVLTVCSALVLPAWAACATPRIVSSLFPPGSHSYVYTPGFDAETHGSSTSESLTGSFWALGGGNPASGQGIDNGGFESGLGWAVRNPGYPTAFHTTWAASSAIDGCIDAAGSSACMAVLFSDQCDDEGYFALLTATSFRGNYSFAQPDSGAIVLGQVPAPQAENFNTFPALFRGSVTVHTPTAGLYLGEGCSQAVVSGYRIYVASTPRDSGAPSVDRSSGSWEVIGGGQGPEGQALPLGSMTEIVAVCQPGMDLYVASSLVFDSGFETRFLSQPLPRVQCE